MNALTETGAETGDRVRLVLPDDYARYFNHLFKVFGLLGAWYDSIEGGDDETEIVSQNLTMFLETVKALRLRQLHDDSRNLSLDLNESGFPHAIGLADLEADLASKASRLKTMLPAKALKQHMLDEMFKTKEDPKGLLTLMGERMHIESLEREKLFLPFNRGDIVAKQTRDGFHECVVWWSCYDFELSRPFIYILAFNYDETGKPLEKGSPALEEFWNVIEEEGSRAATCMVVAAEIDRRIKAVHPKIMKRVSLGPILSKAFAKDRHPLLEVIREYGESEDFAMILTNETIFSSSETKPQWSLFHKEKVRQVFAVPSTDLDCFERQVSMVSYALLIPHHVVQKMDLNHGALQKFKTYTTIAYNQAGELFQI